MMKKIREGEPSWQDDTKSVTADVNGSKNYSRLLTRADPQNGMTASCSMLSCGCHTAVLRGELLEQFSLHQSVYADSASGLTKELLCVNNQCFVTSRRSKTTKIHAIVDDLEIPCPLFCCLAYRYMPANPQWKCLKS